MPKTEEQYESLRENRKQHIMNVAMEIFAERGYHATSISMIAEKAGFSKGLMYNYFDSKDELLDAIVRKGFSDIIALIDQSSGGIKSCDQMQKLIYNVAYQIKENREFWRLYYSLLMKKHIVERYKDELMKFIESYTQRIISFFETRGSDNPVADGLLLGSAFDGVALSYLNATEDFPLDEVCESMIKFFCLDQHKN